jgi:multimeric flavodoxin WrbA
MIGPVRILLVYGGQPNGRTEQLRREVVAGIAKAARADDDGAANAPSTGPGTVYELRERHALLATADDLLWAQGLLLGTPEHFGYMSGALKDFFDRSFYPAEGRTAGLPYGLFVSAGNDGRGTITAVERIVAGYGWRAIADPVRVVGDPDEAALASCRELGGTLIAGLAAGIF